MQEKVAPEAATARMQWASALGVGSTLEDAIVAASGRVTSRLGPEPVDLVFVFVSSTYRDTYERVPGLLREHLDHRTLLGCSGGGVIGGGEEVEFSPAVGITAARLPGVKVQSFHLRDEEMPDLDSGPAEWEKAIGVRAADNPHFVLMVDPFSFNVENMVAGLDFAFPRGAKIGGLASDARERGGNALFLDRRSWRSGLTGVALSGNLEVDAVVAQGCRPVGKPMLITAGRHNCIEELDGRRPLDVLHDLVASLDERDRALVRTSLSLGMVTDPFRLEYQEGDFLIRNLLGIDRERGFLAVGMLVRKGQTVQFHLRDAETSAQDLSRALERIPNPSSPQAALLFSCLGRGQHLYKVSNHDSDAFLRHVGPVPLGGFFCNGEIGPVGGTTFVHGYTSCFALFRPKG